MTAARIRTAGAALGAALVLASAAPAHADSYRYWSFWQQEKGSWAYATEGPASLRPEDGDVQGFRFAVSENSAEAARPRDDRAFEAVCSGTPAEKGAKRVAFVLDFGTRHDAPQGETPPESRTACARVPVDATSAEALAAVAKPLRYDSSAMLCAIGGYPRRGCGEQVVDGGSDSGSGTGRSADSDAPSDAAGDSASGPSGGVLAGIAAVLALGGAAVWQARRNRA
ncbi:SCO2322 family protein [Streptomyces meridianus]|uniref:SCO2322 family protein n=1 Tax=Streptomyces meridianus TaxID=2938945 RepID=A0ABT0X9V3_9ACTN|nr:SCO2322 family protein [Streptomyces meridianus]MCM2579312.1 SCO2322 family protein [Streptomyces meridianus]